MSGLMAGPPRVSSARGFPSIRHSTNPPILLSMRKVLILTAAYGEGHNAAARGLQAALAGLGAAEAIVVNPFAAALGRLYERSRRDYLRIIETLPYLWSAVYQA